MPGFKSEVFERYAEMVADPRNMDLTAAEYAEELGVGKTTIFMWNRKLDWPAINAKRRAAYAQVVHTIDAALLKKAQKGDAKAIELFYTRFDGYIPTTAQVNLTEKADDELKQRAEQIRAELLARSKHAGTGQDLPGAGEARA